MSTNTNPIKARSALFDAIVQSNEAAVVKLLNNSPLKDPDILNEIYDKKIRPYTLYDIAVVECRGRDNTTHPQCRITMIMREKGAMSINEVFANLVLKAIHSRNKQLIDKVIKELPKDSIREILNTPIYFKNGMKYNLLDYTEDIIEDVTIFSILKRALGEKIPLQVPSNSSVLYGPGGIPLHRQALTGVPNTGIADGTRRQVGPLKISGGKRKKSRKTRRKHRKY